MVTIIYFKEKKKGNDAWQFLHTTSTQLYYFYPSWLTGRFYIQSYQTKGTEHVAAMIDIDRTPAAATSHFTYLTFFMFLSAQLCPVFVFACLLFAFDMLQKKN